jgi:hypothetical protein
MKSAVLGTIVLGFALVLISAMWSTLFPATNSWTPEKATRISEIKARLNDLGFAMQNSKNRIYNGRDPAAIKEEYDKLNAEFDELKNAFESAAVTPVTVASYFKWTGLALAAIGIVGYFAVSQS